MRRKTDKVPLGTQTLIANACLYILTGRPSARYLAGLMHNAFLMQKLNYDFARHHSRTFFSAEQFTHVRWSHHFIRKEKLIAIVVN